MPRKPDPDRQEGGEHQVIPTTAKVPVLPPADSLAGKGELIAPRGKFRVIGVDCFESVFSDYLVGDFADKDEAIMVADARAGPMNPVYVYDDAGKLIFSAGRP